MGQGMQPPHAATASLHTDAASLHAGAHTDWHGKPYYSLDAWCKNTYGKKLFKAALDIGCTCPNRDGTLDTRGCIFCSAGGSGDFAASRHFSVTDQIKQAKELLSSKWQTDSKMPCLIAYFQAYTNTYGDPARLLSCYEEALLHPLTAGISIATRPDCLDEPILDGICRLREAFPGKFIWIELGLQTIHDRTAALIRRGYGYPVFEEAMRKLSQRRLPAIIHLILGLPGESPADIFSSVRAVNALSPFGVKLQLLHILKGTDLAALYESGGFSALTKDEYLELLTGCIAALSPDVCIHRVTGDGPRDLLIAPRWSLNKRDVLNSLHSLMKQKNIRQGSNFYESGTTHTL